MFEIKFASSITKFDNNLKLKIQHLVVLGVLLRLVCIVVDNFIFPLPQSGADTVFFHTSAISIKNSWPYSFLETLSNGAILFPTIGAIIYSIFGNSITVWAMTMLPLSILTILYSYKIVLKFLGDRNQALLAALFVSIFPNLVVLQSLILRESVIHFLLVYSVYWFFRFLKEHKCWFLALHFFLILIATIFHSGLISIIIASAIYLLFLKRQSQKWIKPVIVITAFASLWLMDYTGIGLDKFGGSLKRLAQIVMLGGQRLNLEATSNYPSWLLLEGSLRDIYILPLRMLAFYLAPIFPLAIRIKAHLLALPDVLLYASIFIQLFLVRKKLFANSYSKVLLLYVLVFTGVFAFGASNFGTNTRHRAKIVPVLLMLPLCTLDISRPLHSIFIKNNSTDET